MKRLIPTLLVTGALGLLFGQDLRQEFHQTYSLAPNGRIVLKNINGSVHITGWDRSEVKVDAVKKARTQEALDEARIEVNAGGDRIDIQTKYPEGDRRDAAGVDYVVSVPRTAVLETVRTVNGPVRIEAVSGPVKAASVNGNVEVSAVRRPGPRFRERSCSGDIRPGDRP
ncbi:MAG TPA: hypothetical protein VN428_03945 [Bryobacteraceae bacterium]|nr:hypothetical protein [Bryobacteraceae bacterium]